MEEPSLAKLTSAHFYGWEHGLKGTYYLRSRPITEAIKVTLKPTQTNTIPDDVCTMEEGCLSCGS